MASRHVIFRIEWAQRMVLEGRAGEKLGGDAPEPPLAAQQGVGKSRLGMNEFRAQPAMGDIVVCAGSSDEAQ